MSIKRQKAKFNDVLKNLPQKAGVYRYYDIQGNLLYIGKAKNLKRRVSSYFLEGKIHNKRIYLLVNQIERIEYTIVKNEKESLLLEANLIFNLQPKFNILLKDEQSYFYLRFAYEEEVPSISIVRKKLFPKSVYYGPFQNKFKIVQILRTLRMILPFCEQKKLGKLCDYADIGLCSGVCGGKESLENYKKRLGQIENIFKGKGDLAEKYLDEKIREAVMVENYELAGFWRDRKNLLISLFQSNFAHQKVVLPEPENMDLVTLVVELDDQENYIGSLFLQNIRDGKMVNVNNFLFTGDDFLDQNEEKKEDLFEKHATSFLKQFFQNYYLFNHEVAPVLLNIYCKKG